MSDIMNDQDMGRPAALALDALHAGMIYRIRCRNMTVGVSATHYHLTNAKPLLE